jgi:hypothetical protein
MAYQPAATQVENIKIGDAVVVERKNRYIHAKITDIWFEPRSALYVSIVEISYDGLFYPVKELIDIHYVKGVKTSVKEG